MLPKKRITFEDKLTLAKQAIGLDDEAFRNLAKQARITSDQLACYLNAYEAAGESGVRALDYTKAMTDDVRQEATVKLTKYFENRVPPEHRNEIGFLVKAQGNKVIIAERRPFFMDKSKWTTSEFIRMVYTDYDNRWHLYWKCSSGKWFPFVPEKPVFTVEDCIREFGGKSATCFWG